MRNRLKNWNGIGRDDISGIGKKIIRDIKNKLSGDDRSDLKYVDDFRKDFIDKSASTIQDPLFLSFGLRFDFFPRIGESDSLEPGLLSGGARRFLSMRGDTQRVTKLDYFTRMLNRFSVEEPWFFQSISGISSIYNIDVQKGVRVSNGKITVKTLETINMRFMSMAESYRSCVYDKRFMRDMLPGNLKKFDMSIYITDPRLLYKFEKGKRLYDNDSQGVVVLKLKDCVFNFDSLGSSFDSIDNATIDNVVNYSFSVDVGRVNEVYNLPTRELFGYGGSGFFSDDYVDDYNFLLNLVRPQSMNYAEAGNERRINLMSNSDYESLKRTLNKLENGEL